jgi:hypothetical protein
MKEFPNYPNPIFMGIDYSKLLAHKVSENVIVLVTPRIVCLPEAEVRETKTGSFMTGVSCNSSSGVVGTVCEVPCPKAVAATCMESSPSTPACCQAKTPAMNLADVVALSSSGVSDEIIRLQIETTYTRFNLTTEDILWLKKNKVSDNIVTAMQISSTKPAPTPPAVVATPMPAPAYPPQLYVPAQYAPLPTALPSPIPYLKPTRVMPPPAPTTRSSAPDQPTGTSQPLGPKPISLDLGFPYPVAGISGAITFNERNFDSKRSQSPQAGEIGEKVLAATAELVSGVAGFVGEELPAILADAGEAVRPKVKLTVEFKLERK